MCGWWCMGGADVSSSVSSPSSPKINPSLSVTKVRWVQPEMTLGSSSHKGFTTGDPQDPNSYSSRKWPPKSRLHPYSQYSLDLGSRMLMIEIPSAT